MTRPTESAINEFHVARQHSGRAFIRIPVGDPNAEIALAIKSLADGLINLSTGLRATYMLLEEVKGLLQKKPASPECRKAGGRANSGVLVGATDKQGKGLPGH